MLEIEQRVTEMLVLRHELDLFLDDVARHLDNSVGQKIGGRSSTASCWSRPAATSTRPRPASSLQKLTERLGCNLAGAEWETLFADLRGRHLHIWRDDDGYTARFPDPDPGLLNQALQAAGRQPNRTVRRTWNPSWPATTAACCSRPAVPNAFLFAQLFLALEADADA